MVDVNGAAASGHDSHAVVSGRRIAVFLPTLNGGGAERNMFRLAEQLLDAGAAVTIVVADARGPLRSLVPDQAHFIDLSARMLALSLIPLTRWLRRSDVDVMISAINGANVVALAARLMSRQTFPLVVSERNTLSSWRRDGWSVQRRFIIPWLVRRTYRHADAIVAVSHATADDLAVQARLPRGTIDVIANPVVGPALFAAGREACVQSDGWPDDVPTIVAIGRLVAQKDHDVLFDAFARLRARGVVARLVVIGEGPRAERLHRMVGERGLDEAITFAGFLANPYPSIRRAEVLVSTSRYEGLPTVLIEALALGTKVVATDAPGGTRQVLGDGQWGRLVPVGDPEAVAEALEEALGAPDVSQPEAVAPYGHDKVADTWMQLIARVMSPD